MEYFASNQFYIHEIMPHELGTNIQICLELKTDFVSQGHSFWFIEFLCLFTLQPPHIKIPTFDDMILYYDRYEKCFSSMVYCQNK